MVIFKFFKFFFTFLSLIVFLLAVFVGGFLLFNGADFSLTLGENWFLYHDKSLYLTEPFVSRYLQPFVNIFTDKDLWLDVIVANILQAKTYIVLLIAIIGSAAVFALLRLLP